MMCGRMSAMIIGSLGVRRRMTARCGSNGTSAILFSARWRRGRGCGRLSHSTSVPAGSCGYGFAANRPGLALTSPARLILASVLWAAGVGIKAEQGCFHLSDPR